MSNFKGWTSEQYEAFERERLAKRLDEQRGIGLRKVVFKKRRITPNEICDKLKPDQIGAQTVTTVDAQLEIFTSSNGQKTYTRTETKSGTEITMVKPRKAKAKPTPAPRDHIGTTFIGVDPALRAGGFWLCIICRVDNTATFKSCKHLGEFVRILQDASPAAVIVENSNLQKKKFNEKSGVGGALSVGKNQGVSQAATDIANEYSDIPSGISPKQKGAKVTNDVVFQGIVRSNNLTLTSYKGAIKAAQDQRDALMLALICEQQYKLHLKVNK